MREKELQVSAAFAEAVQEIEEYFALVLPAAIVSVQVAQVLAAFVEVVPEIEDSPAVEWLVVALEKAA